MNVGYGNSDECRIWKPGIRRWGIFGGAAVFVGYGNPTYGGYGNPAGGGRSKADAFVKNPNCHPERSEGSLRKTKCIIIADA